MDNKERFLDELKIEYNKHFELTKRLEEKANALLTICGITIPLLFGFSSFLLEHMDEKYYFMKIIKILITIGISTRIAIFYILMFFKSTKYYHAIIADEFYKFDKNNQPDMAELNKIISKSEEDYINNRIFNHLECISLNEENNHIRSELLKKAQWIFGIGITTIPIAVAILLFNIPNIKL